VKYRALPANEYPQWKDSGEIQKKRRTAQDPSLLCALHSEQRLKHWIARMLHRQKNTLKREIRYEDSQSNLSHESSHSSSWLSTTGYYNHQKNQKSGKDGLK